MTVLLAPGRWRVDPDRSSVTFSARGFWGAVPATGAFSDLSGGAAVEADGGLEGDLVIEAATLNTGLALRDRHLRSGAFFDVERYPEIRFAARELRTGADGKVIRGTLRVRDRSIELALPVQLADEGERVALTVDTVLERDPLGLGHSALGMIRGPARVRVHIVLERDR